MRLKHLLSVFLTLLTLSVGQMWGADPTKTTTFTSNSFSVDGWSKTSQTSIQAYSNNCIQVTWNSIKSKSLVLSNSSDFSGKIIKGVSLNYYSNGGSGSMQVKVAGNNFGSAKTLSGGSSGSHNNASVTGSASGTITITVTTSSTSSSLYIKSITVTYVNGTAATITLNNYTGNAETSGYYSGDSFMLPNTNNYTCGTKTFVGWSTVEVEPTNTKPTSNFYKPGAYVTLAASNTFYAVYAVSGGETEETIEATYTSSSGWTSSSTCGSSYWVFCGSSSLASPSFDDLSKITNIAFKMRTNGGTSYNKIKIQTDGNTQIGSISTSDGTTWADKSLASADFSNTLSGSGKIVFTNGGSNSTTGGPSINNIVITYNASSFSNYATTCCTPLGSINGSFS